MSKVRHLLGISGGKDSAALAIYMKNKFPELDIEYYTSDTGKELDETYQLIENLEIYLGKKIVRLKAYEDSPEAPFDHKLKSLGGFLPSQRFRWCTKSLKLDVFEKFVGSDQVISYVGIREDENREGYISRKNNIQSIFPFRRNIWSEDVINKVMSPSNTEQIIDLIKSNIPKDLIQRFIQLYTTPISIAFSKERKLEKLFDLGVVNFNKVILEYIKTTPYPLASVNMFPLVDKEETKSLEDILELLRVSNVGIPAYYNPVEFEINGVKSTYARSRSGCFFCFYQQKIEWVWLYEQHPDKFQLAMEYEKEGYTWNDDESLLDLIQPDRLNQIKSEYAKRANKTKKNTSQLLVDILVESEGEGCASCFI